MNYFKVKSAGIIGNKLISIDIECVQQRRMPYLQIIGGPTGSQAAQRERILAAIDSSGFKLPSRRITVSMIGAFAGVSTEMADLAVALAILGSSGQFSQEKIAKMVACGSLSLEGKLLPLSSRAPIRTWMENHGESALILPWEDSQLLEESQNGGGFHSLNAVVGFLKGNSLQIPRKKTSEVVGKKPDETFWRVLSGRQVAQRLVQVAAAGRHPLFVSGGMEEDARAVAEAVNCLCPPMPAPLLEEVSAIQAVFGEVFAGQRPFRQIRPEQAPRLLRFDSASGMWGEMSLAHGGTLYLQGLGDRPLGLLQRMQEPLESGLVRGFRSGKSVAQSADWALIARILLCPCGASGMQRADCRCPASEVEKFRQKLDQVRPFFHLRHHLGEVSAAETPISFPEAAQKVANAIAMSPKRGGPNARLTMRECFAAKPWSEEALNIWRASRGVNWQGMAGAMAKVALTVSDLRQGEQVSREDMLESRHYVPSPFASISRSGRSLSRLGDPEINSTAMP